MIPWQYGEKGGAYRQLFGSKKDNVRDEAGAGGEVTLGRGVTVHAAGRPVAVPRVQASALPYPRPGDELNTELGWVARQDYAIEIRQQSVVPRQAAGRQLGRCLHLAHIFGGSFGDGDHTVQGGASVLISRIFPPVPHRAGGPSKTEALAVQLHRQEALLCFRFYGEALTLEVQG